MSMKEKISALLDGEINSSELDVLLDEMRQQPELRKQWGRYARIQSSLHNEEGPDVADRVWAELQAEPAILAPRKSGIASHPLVRRYAAGLAVAATVAAAAVGSLNWYAPSFVPQTQLLAKGPEQADYIRTSGTHWQVDDPKLEDDLNMYLVEHGGYAGSSSMLSYVKVAGYDEENK
ncbi:MAG: sigma-E factor negative regulatory protein [Acidiferrobacterales bacterium]|jgi:sigma-E factor negative regulatory protein RseA|nr:sigma-E factor negative regulatory protein [Acidiferrobacterales bacterium]